MRSLSLAKVLGCAFAFGISLISSAHEHYFTYTYDWYTPFQGERELEFHFHQLEGGPAIGMVEFEYGITDRWVVAPYLIWEHEDGKTKFEGWKLEQRYRFGEFAYKKLLPAVYVEIEKENHESYELEAKLIGSYLPNPKWIISGNLVFERALESGAENEWGYTFGAGHRYRPDQHIGLEVFGSLQENEHFAGPVIGFGRARDLKVIATAAAPIAGDGPYQFRLLLEKEF